MPRPKRQGITIEAPALNEEAIAKSNDAARAMVAIDGAAAGLALTHLDTAEIIGAFKAVGFINRTLQSVHVRLFKELREKKGYIGYPYRDENGIPRSTTNLEDFCQRALGVSYDTLREREAQHDALGESAFDSAMGMLLTFPQLRAIQGADADVRKQVVAALERGARTEALDLVDELLAERREKAKALKEATEQLEAKDKVLDQKNRKIDQLTSATLSKPEWHQQLEKAIATVGETFTKLQLACAEAARLTETIAELEFDGVERESDLLALRAQVAVQFHGRSELWLDQGVALVLAEREKFVDALMSLAAKKLPEDVKAKLFGERS